MTRRPGGSMDLSIKSSAHALCQSSRNAEFVKTTAHHCATIRNHKTSDDSAAAMNVLEATTIHLHFGAAATMSQVCNFS